jgi:ABC-type Zn uptake system ZnuABC Zn-binding protein ZnuA
VTAVRAASPLESLTKKERADKADYFTLMDANLEKIATALGCPPRS